jgi:cytoskeletal protein CcmA (bactofilin family)
MFSKASSKTKSDVATTAITGTSTVASEAPRPAPRSTAPSIISGDLKIQGNLTSAGDLQIDGIVEGDIQSRSLTVGEGAAVTGNITADTVRVCGQVTGQIKAGTVNLERTAKVMGDIVHQILSLEPGAFLEGHVRHNEAPGGSSSLRASPAPASTTATSS